MTLNERYVKYICILAFAVMFVMGFIDGMRGPLIPWIRSTFGVNYSSIGVMLLVASLGFLTATFFGGMLCDRLGERKIFYIGLILIGLGIVGLALSKNFGIFVFMMGFMNLGLGSVDIGSNSLISGIQAGKKAVLMNLLHFFYGLGASIGPRYSGQIISIGFSWQSAYKFSVIMTILLFIYFLFVKFPEREEHSHQEKNHIFDIMKDKKALLFGAVMGFYIASELGVVNWFANYLTVVYGMDEIKSSSYLSIFFMTFTFGRLVGGYVAEFLGYLNAVRIFMIIALLMFLSGIFLGEQYMLLISACGLFFSIVFPTIATAVVNEFDKSKAATLGFVITTGCMISMFTNWIMGKLNDILGVRNGFGAVAVFIGISILLVSVLEAQSKEKYKEVEEAI